MKKKLLICISTIFILGAFSQIDSEKVNLHHKNYNNINVTNPTNLNFASGDDYLWSFDISDTTMISTEDVAGYGEWKWSTTAPGGQWSENAGVIQSETPEDGFMLMEADFYNTSPQNNVTDGEVGEFQLNSNFTIGPIDLSSSETEQLVLQFYSNYRICCYYSPSPNNDLNVYIGFEETDSTGTASINYSDLNYIEGETFEVNTEKETLSQIPLGNFAPNTTGVYFKFEWIGTHYFWMIDDISVIQRPAYDLKMQSSWLAMQDPQNIEYYNIPINQMPNEMYFGSEVYNYGYTDESNVTLNGIVNGTTISSSFDYQLIQSDSTVFVETNYFDVSSLNTGIYSFTTEIISNGDDPTPFDNTLTRNFEISDNTYALDGLYESYDYQGTGWPGGDDTSDGLMLGNYFDFKNATTLSSIAVMLDTDAHPTSLGTFQTQPGGEVIAYVLDTTGINDYFTGITTNLNAMIGGVIWQSDFILVTQQDVDNGMLVIDVDELQINPGAYYVAIEMYSNGLASDIILFDDTSVAQPYYASMYYNPAEQTWYTNPNALSIRLGLNGFENIIDENSLTGVSCFPIPAKNFIEISTDKTLLGETEISIYNMLGKIVWNTKFEDFGQIQNIDLVNITKGNYVLEIHNNDKLYRQKIVVE